MSGDRGEEGATASPSLGAGAGDWIMPPVSYVDPARRFCEFCGRPIARKFWRAEREGGAGIFCDPGHAALYATYPGSVGDNEQP